MNDFFFSFFSLHVKLACLKSFFFFARNTKKKVKINLTSDQTRLPAEFKHINKRRKRN